MRKGWIFVALLAARPAEAESARPERSISLRGAIELAIHDNPTLAAAVADVEIARGVVEAARGIDDPLLDANAGWTESRQQLVSGSPLQEPSFGDVLGTVSLTQPLSSGGRLGLVLSNEYTRTDFATPSGANAMTFDRQTSSVYAPSVKLTLQHSLLRGLGAGVARADRRRAAVRRDIAGLTREATVAALVREVVSAYADLAYTAEELEILRASATAARDQLQRVKADIEVGKQPPSGSAEVEVALSRRDEAVLLAEQAIVERSLELERLAGQPVDRRSSTLVASEHLTLPEPTPAIDQALEEALEHNPQLRIAEVQGRAASIEVDVTASSLLPQLDVALSGGPSGNAADPRTAYSELARFHGYTLGASVVFQEPLGRHAARGFHDAARATQHKAELGKTDLRQQIASAVVRGIAAIESAKRRAAILARSIDAAALDLAAERARFESGRSTNFDVLRRQDQLALTKLSALGARLDHAKALAGVESLTGAILARYGVVVR